MKPSSDKSMADHSKVSSEKVPMSEKKGQFGASIKPMGIDMWQGHAPEAYGYDHVAGADEMEGGLQNPRFLPGMEKSSLFSRVFALTRMNPT